MEPPTAFGLMLLMFMSLIFGMFIVVPAIGQFPQTTNGEVTSVARSMTLWVSMTTINFKDGSMLHVYGSFDVSLGVHIFESHSSWMWISVLTEIDGESV